MQLLKTALTLFVLIGVSCAVKTTQIPLQIAPPPAIALPLPEQESEEEQFQDQIDSLFERANRTIDTTNWCTTKINGSWLDYNALLDTVTIQLVNSSCGYCYTHPVESYVTSPFGPRHNFWHYGVDIKVQIGDTIRCAFSGRVRVLENDRRGYGRVVVVRHQNGLETLYGHLSRTTVAVNQELQSGDVIGLGGNTGRSTGSHLHFEMRYCGEPFDPNSIIDFDTYTLKAATLTLSPESFTYLTDLRKTVYHRIAKGETLGSVAHKYHSSIRALCTLNGIRPTTLLRVGRKLLIRKKRPVVHSNPVETSSSGNITKVQGKRVSLSDSSDTVID